MSIRISLNRRNDKSVPRHVVVTVDGTDMANVGVVLAEVVGRGRKIVHEVVPDSKKVKYRFHLDYLDTLLLAMPQADRSEALQKRLDRRANHDLMQDVEPIEVPGLWNYKDDTPAVPFNYQIPAILKMLSFLSGDQDGMDAEQIVEHMLENDEMGLGKTFMMLCALSLLLEVADIKRVLVVAPKNGKYVWRKQNAMWFGDKFSMALIDAEKQTPAQRTNLIKSGAFLTVVNPEALRGKWVTKPGGKDPEFRAMYPALFEEEWDIVIFDEYHRFGNPTSQQTQGMLNLRAQRFLPASGTPYMTRVEQLWPILHRCWPELYPDYKGFCEAITLKSEDGKATTVGYRPKVAKALRTFMGSRSVRRRKDQVLKDLPEVMPVDMPIELNREQRRIYNQIRDRFKMELEDGTIKSLADVRVRIMRLKQAAFSPELFGGSKHSAKIDELHEIVRSLTDSGEKAIIFSEWKKATRIIQRELGDYKHCYVDGSVTGERRSAQEDQFNNDPDTKLYIGTIGANKEAISLGTASYVIFTDKDPSPQVNDQARDRSGSGGLRGLDSKSKTITVVSMIGADTYEERVEAVLKERKDMFNALIETDGGRRPPKKVIHSILELI